MSAKDKPKFQFILLRFAFVARNSWWLEIATFERGFSYTSLLEFGRSFALEKGPSSQGKLYLNYLFGFSYLFSLLKWRLRHREEGRTMRELLWQEFLFWKANFFAV